MAIIPGLSIVRSLALFHLALAYYFTYSPQTLAKQNMVTIIGAAVQMPYVDSLDEPNALSSFVGLVFLYLGLSDLISVSMAEEVARFHWDSQAPIRLLFFFVLTGYAYITKPGGLNPSQGLRLTPAGPGVQNSLIFSWAFIELVMWFWIYVTLRDERKDSAAKLAQKRAAEDNSL